MAWVWVHLKNHLVSIPMPWAGLPAGNKSGCLGLHSTECIAEASITSLGNMFMCLTILWVIFFLRSNPNLLSFSWKPFSLVLSILHSVKKKHLSLAKLLLSIGRPNTFPLEPSLHHVKQDQLLQPVFIGEVLQTSDHLQGPSLFLFQQLYTFIVLWVP